jgi:transporter family-2 protein
MKAMLILIALFSGATIAFQVGVNGELRLRTQHPLLAAAISFLTGTVVLVGVLSVIQPRLPDREALASSPWWMWLGGLVGAVYVTSAAEFAPRMGAAPWLGLVVTGQILSSLALDHYGLVGFPTHPLTWPRVLGAILLLCGVFLVLRN